MDEDGLALNFFASGLVRVVSKVSTRKTVREVPVERVKLRVKRETIQNGEGSVSQGHASKQPVDIEANERFDNEQGCENENIERGGKEKIWNHTKGKAAGNGKGKGKGEGTCKREGKGKQEFKGIVSQEGRQTQRQDREVLPPQPFIPTIHNTTGVFAEDCDFKSLGLADELVRHLNGALNGFS